MDKIIALVNVRERCVSELMARLDKAGFSHEIAEQACKRSVECGLVDEERYTRAFIRGKSGLGWGRGKILSRLTAAGIDQSIIDACEPEFRTEDEEYERALGELLKRKSASKDPYASYMRRLISKGYAYETARRATEAVLERRASSS